MSAVLFHILQSPCYRVWRFSIKADMIVASLSPHSCRWCVQLKVIQSSWSCETPQGKPKCLQDWNTMWSSFFTKLSIFGSIDYEPFPHFLIICAGHLHNCQNPCLETATIINSDSLQQEVVCSDDYHPVEGFVSTDNTSIGGLFCA